MHYVWAIAGAWTQGNDAVGATYVVVGVVLLTTSNRSLFQMG